MTTPIATRDHHTPMQANSSDGHLRLHSLHNMLLYVRIETASDQTYEAAAQCKLPTYRIAFAERPTAHIASYPTQHTAGRLHGEI